MANDSTFTRRVCAILLADVSGFSALMGQDDERTARAIGDLLHLVDGIVAEAGGNAESVAGDAIFATFDSVLAAVQAALQIQERIGAREISGTKLQVRIGVHFGDVLLRDGKALGDAINIAARLEGLAAPGTVCVSDGVYRHVRNKFDVRVVDLGSKQLKNISDPVHAYLLVPSGAAAPKTHGKRTSPWVLALAACLLAGVAAAFLLTTRSPQKGSLLVSGDDRDTPAQAAKVAAADPAGGSVDAEARQVALGVMEFKTHGDTPGNNWKSEALRDSLNNQLSQLSGVKVYSKEFIDFLITRQGLTEVEAATKLGISKMVSGSVARVGSNLRIETHVVDCSSGVMESSYTTEGKEEEFHTLENQLMLGVIAQLKLPVSAQEKAMLLAKRAADPDALKALLEAEGVGHVGPPPPSTHAPRRLPYRLASGLHRLLTATAFAGEPQQEPQEEPAIRAALERYRQAMEARRVEDLGRVYTEFPPEQQVAQEKYFQNVRDLKVALDNIDVAVIGDEAVASYTRTDDFVDTRTGRPIHVSVRLTKILRKLDDGWRLAPK